MCVEFAQRSRKLGHRRFGNVHVEHAPAGMCSLLFRYQRAARGDHKEFSIDLRKVIMHACIHTYIHTYVRTYVHICMYLEASRQLSL